MTLIEAAALLGVTPDNLRGAIKRGALKAAKHGRDWWVEPKEVERYRLEHRRGDVHPVALSGDVWEPEGQAATVYANAATHVEDASTE